MDNFTIWVDAPSEALIETPLDDESSCYLRDEILLTQQYVFEKLDEQKTNETEKEEHAVQEKEQEQKLLSLIAAEGKRTKSISTELVGYREAVKSIELQLVSIKNDFPAKIKLQGDEHEKLFAETNNEISILQDNVRNREKSIRKLLENDATADREKAKKECKKLRNSILESKQRHEKLSALSASCRKFQAEYESGNARQQQERELLGTAREKQKAEETLLAQMSEEAVTLRSDIMELEAKQSKNRNEIEQKELENFQNSATKMRQENKELSSKLSKVKEETEDAQKKLEKVIKEELETEELVKEREKQIVAILQKRIVQAKRKLKNANEHKKIAELRKAVNKETSVLAKAKQELENVNINKKTMSQLKREVSTMNAEIRSIEKRIQESTKENNKLKEQIDKMRGVDEIPSPITAFNDTAEITDSQYSEQMCPPQPFTAITPIQKRGSQDVFTGEFMTSTPLQKAPEASVKTRAAARRLERNAAVKTAEFKKKRGGKK
ncbi:unnamed protein product [Caenorhabditis brenneri]